MCGGSESSQDQQTTTYNYDDDLTVTGGGIAIGREGNYVPQEVESESQGVQAIGSSVAQLENSAIYVAGKNSSIFVQDMDTETENVIIRALEVSARNAENFMNLAAGNEIENPQGEIDPSEVALAKVEETSGSLKWIVAGGAVLGLMWVFKKGGKK